MFGVIAAPALAKTSTAARDALDSMIASPARHVGYSLDAIHRAVGSPARQGVDDWLDLSRPVVDAMRGYRRKVYGATVNEHPSELPTRDPLVRINGDTVAALDAVAGKGHGYLERDYVADEEVALLYCLFLDSGGFRRNLTAEGKRSRLAFEAKMDLYPAADRVRRLEPMPKRVFEPNAEVGGKQELRLTPESSTIPVQII
jgi:hypothetical protein